MKISLNAAVVFLSLVFGGCHCNKIRKNVDLTGIEVNMEIKRLDNILFRLSPENMNAQFPAIDSIYRGFLSFYVRELLALGDYYKEPDSTIARLNRYLSDPYVKEVRDSCERIFGDTKIFEDHLTNAFRYYKFYFPEKNVPDVVTFISNFSYSAITYDTFFLGIGTDMYLGKNFKYYPDLYPKYMYEKFSPEYLTANCMKALAAENFKIEPHDNTMLSHMISNGLVLYLTDLVMPDEEDYRKIGYNPEDINWCFVNEPEIWKFLIDRDLLYTVDTEKQKLYIAPGPSSSGMPKDAPGNVATWVGWQIVRAYAKKYPELTFEELLEEDPQTMLAQSGYKPSRRLF